MKGQDIISEKQPNEVEIGSLLEKKFRIMTVKMIQELRIKQWRQRLRRYKKSLPKT